jgi:hypothetical protein
LRDRLGLSARWFVLRESLRNRTKRNSQQRPVLLLSLRHLRQRYLFLLAQCFSRCGFFVHLDLPISRQSYWDTDSYARYVFEEPQLKATQDLPEDRAQAYLCLDHDEIDVRGWGKVIRLDYDIKEGLSRPGAVIVPYWMHPNVYRHGLADTLSYWRHGQRPVRLFFAGNLSPDRYTAKGPLNQDKLGRREILEHILEDFGSRTVLVRDPDQLKDIMARGSRGIVIFDGTKARLSREEWFPALGKCEYFLALPGVVMPMSHNLIEAMGLGCVPVCNYPEWLSPRLVNGRDCLAFTDRQSLGLAIEAVLGADPGHTARLRTGSLGYFATNLQPEAFLRPVLQSPERMVTVYVNAEEVSEKAALAAKERQADMRAWSL